MAIHSKKEQQLQQTQKHNNRFLSENFGVGDVVQLGFGYINLCAYVCTYMHVRCCYYHVCMYVCIYACE